MKKLLFHLEIKLSPSPKAKQKIPLLEWMQTLMGRSAQASQSASLGTLKKHLEVFLAGEDNTGLLLADVDRDFCLRFVNYLNHARNLRIRADRPPRPLAPNTRKRIFSLFAVSLQQAQKEGLVSSNPIEEMARGERPRPIPTHRPYLSREELLMMIHCPNGPEDVRRAFLFSCLTGLRWSDICSLKWNHFHREGDNWFIVKRMVKTGGWFFNPIAGEARQLLLRQTGKADEYCFSLPSASAVNRDLKRWARAAGVEKNISFHTARHTFATLLITEGADIYTTSQLLGHTNVATTQIYAKVVDRKKQQAISLISGALK